MFLTSTIVRIMAQEDAGIKGYVALVRARRRERDKVQSKLAKFLLKVKHCANFKRLSGLDQNLYSIVVISTSEIILNALIHIQLPQFPIFQHYP